MSATILQTSLKGKEKAVETSILASRGSNAFGRAATSDSDSEEEADLEVTQEFLDSLLERAKENLAAKARQKHALENAEEEEVLTLDASPQQPLPSLDPGPSLPSTYFAFGETLSDASKLVRDPETELVEAQSSSGPRIPVLPELSKSGKPLTKREKRELKDATAGPQWFDLPAPAPSDLPRLYREVEALRLRKSLDPKRFYKKEEGEGKGIKGLPKHFAIGTVVDTPTPFHSRSMDNLTRAERKRTIVDELVEDDEAKTYAKRKFMDLQGVRGERGRGTWRRKREARKPKW